jgi:phytoene dehydrogenase-like protein
VHVGVAYTRSKLEGPFDAIVVGSGMGGLTTAAILARHAGKRVLVLERHYTAGGFTHSFTRPGYEWDVGVHYIGQVGERQTLRRIFDYVTEGRRLGSARAIALVHPLLPGVRGRRTALLPRSHSLNLPPRAYLRLAPGPGRSRSRG